MPPKPNNQQPAAKTVDKNGKPYAKITDGGIVVQTATSPVKLTNVVGIGKKTKYFGKDENGNWYAIHNKPTGAIAKQVKQARLVAKLDTYSPLADGTLLNITEDRLKPAAKGRTLYLSSREVKNNDW